MDNYLKKNLTKKKILIVDDDEAILLGLEVNLQNAGYQVFTATDGAKALKVFQEEGFDVVISDYQMPNLDGLGFVTKVKELGHDPMFIILTAVSDVPMVVEIMKQGVYDYVPKPPDMEALLIKIDRAFEVAELRKIKQSVEQEQVYRMEKQAAWNRWKEDVEMRDHTKTDSFLFYNLKTSLSQGAGFGSLLVLISFLSSQIQEVDGKYLVDKETMNLLNESAEICTNVLGMFSEIYELIDEGIELKPVTLEQVYQLLKKMAAENNRFLQYKNQEIKIADLNAEFKNLKIEGNLTYLEKAFRELFINACKFSTENSSIIVLINSDKVHFNLNFINSPMVLTTDNTKYQGIEEGYQRLIFEPFFRLTKHVDERYESLDFGLGLTFVSRVIQKHNGRIKANNVVFHTASMKGGDVRVNIEVEIPLYYPNL